MELIKCSPHYHWTPPSLSSIALAKLMNNNKKENIFLAPVWLYDVLFGLNRRKETFRVFRHFLVPRPVVCNLPEDLNCTTLAADNNDSGVTIKFAYVMDNHDEVVMSLSSMIDYGGLVLRKKALNEFVTLRELQSFVKRHYELRHRWLTTLPHCMIMKSVATRRYCELSSCGPTHELTVQQLLTNNESTSDGNPGRMKRVCVRDLRLPTTSANEQKLTAIKGFQCFIDH